MRPSRKFKFLKAYYSSVAAIAAAKRTTLEHQRITLVISGWSSGVITTNRGCFCTLAPSKTIFAASEPTNFYQANH